MANVTGAVEQDVSGKIDLGFIRSEFASSDVTFFFACTNDSEWQSARLLTSYGEPLFVIKLSYSKVKRMPVENVRRLMMVRAQKRLRQVA